MKKNYISPSNDIVMVQSFGIICSSGSSTRDVVVSGSFSDESKFN